MAQIPSFPLSCRARIPKHPESSAARSWKRGEASVGIFFWLLYPGGARTAFKRGEVAWRTVSASQETCNRYNVCLEVSALAETRTPGDVLTSHFANARVCISGREEKISKLLFPLSRQHPSSTLEQAANGLFVPQHRREEG